MHSSSRLASIVAGFIILSAALTSIASADARQQPQAVDATTKLVSSAHNAFGIQLFKEIVQQDQDKNIFISPASAAMALAMVYNGADGVTRDEMARVLELEGITLEQINQANLALDSLLECKDTSVELSVANSVWMTDEFEFKKDFLDRTEAYYDAEITSMDFKRPGAHKLINDWTAEKTRDKIREIIGPIDENAIMFLLNAVYFKGIWKYQFREENTREQDFTLLDGSIKQHPLMSLRGEFDYTESPNFQAIRLPYGEGRFSMLVFLPASDFGLERFHDSLTAENWIEWGRRLWRREGTIILPRFKLEYEKQLNDALKALCMITAFDKVDADFSKMWEQSRKRNYSTGFLMEGDTNVYIHEVRQKTFLEVNEKGSEAAAVTVVEMRGFAPTSVQMPVRPFVMTVNRPFFCAIVENTSGLILFMGSIVDP
ncbi:MAG: serpin family protein [candidate division Zixibacteria bacterium]|nr:serpin family protein [candidate division Zixibacteria bacterium]MBU1471280.1 serpin family protein [candidate division Zixibacteria bacterium]